MCPKQEVSVPRGPISQCQAQPRLKMPLGHCQRLVGFNKTDGSTEAVCRPACTEPCNYTDAVRRVRLSDCISDVVVLDGPASRAVCLFT